MTPPLHDELGVDGLRFERRGPVAWCVVDRPQVRNALTSDMYRGLGRAVDLTAEAPELRALVITGTGDVFVPGGEIEWVEGRPPPKPSEFLPYRALRDSPVPVVACVNGICQASGVMLALLADVSIASERATFRAPELLRGMPDMWLAAVLPAHVGVGRAADIVISGRRLDAYEALGIGLVTRVVLHDELAEVAQQAALELLRSAPEARKVWRAALTSRYGAIDDSLLDDWMLTPEPAEGLRSFLEKRRPAWEPSPPA